jgi:hypothetical protein
MISKRLAREYGGFAPDHKTVIAIRQYCKGVAGGSIEYILTSPQYRQWERSKVNNAEEKKDESVEGIVNTTKKMLVKMLGDVDSTPQYFTHAEAKKEESFDQAKDISHPEEKKEEIVHEIIEAVRKMVEDMLGQSDRM